MTVAALRKPAVSAVTETDVLILGGGASGIAAAATLSERGHRVVLADTYAALGGNHISKEIDGRSYDIGSIFFRDDAVLFRLFPDLLSRCVSVDRRILRLTPGGEVFRYPFDLKRDFGHLPLTRKLRVAREMLSGRVTQPHPASLDAYFTRYIGGTLRKSTGIDTYVHRFYGVGPDEIDAAFADSRMSWVKNHASLRRRLRRRPPGQNARFVVRPAGGFSDLYDPVADALLDAGVDVQCGVQISDITREQSGFTAQVGDTTVRATRLLNTMPIEIFSDLANLPDVIAPPSRRLVSLFCIVKGPLGFDGNVLYNFHEDGAWKRLTVHSDFYGQTNGYHHFTAEVTTSDDALPAHGDLFVELRDTLRRFGLCTGDMQLAGSMETAFAYPVMKPAALAERDAALAMIGEMGVETAGRQGRFEYFPTAALAMRRTIERVLR